MYVSYDLHMPLSHDSNMKKNFEHIKYSYGDHTYMKGMSYVNPMWIV